MSATILVVEDNPITRKMLRVTLETEGYGVIEAADARQAIATAEQRLPDLVLQDLILPDMDGIELARRLRALHGGAELPILALSGFLSRLEELRRAEGDFTALLVKPIEPDLLIESIRAYLPQRRAAAPPANRERRLLIVDDDPVQLKLARIQLSGFGFDVTTASHAAEALDRARTDRPNVVLSDVFMPGMDGFQFCMHARGDPALAGIPIVLVSSQYGSREDEDLARSVGASALVLRTPGFEAVAIALEEALRTGPPSGTDPPGDAVRLLHAQRVIHQLEKQSDASGALAQRCAFQAAQLSLLSGVADALAHKGNVDVVLRDVLAATLDAAGISKGALILRDAAGVLQLRQAIGFSDEERGALRTFFGYPMEFAAIVAAGASTTVPSSAVPEHLSQAILGGARADSAQIVPLLSDGHGVGAMFIASTRTDVTTDDAIAFARAMGNQVAQSLALAQSLERLNASEERLRQAQKLEAIGQLAGGIAHDFNNILTAILGFSELLLSDLTPDDPSRKDLLEIKHAGERAAGLTRQLLAFSRKQILQPRVLDINPLIASLEPMLKRLIFEHIDLRTSLAPDAGLIRIDPTQLEQILVNLAVNARDAMPRGGKLTIETAHVILDEHYQQRHLPVTPGDYVMLAVSDTGVGMDDETARRIFEPFFTTKEAGKGTGLGMATVYGIVKQSGGDILVYSAPGRGTAFKIYFPQTAAHPAAPAERTGIRRETPRGSETILLVEDDETVRLLARVTLERAGYQVLQAGNPKEAIRLADEHRGAINLLVSDVIMPESEGPPLLDRLAASRPGLRVLYMSGYADEAIVRHGVLREGEAFLQKPFTPHALEVKIREVLDAPPPAARH